MRVGVPASGLRLICNSHRYNIIVRYCTRRSCESYTGYDNLAFTPGSGAQNCLQIYDIYSEPAHPLVALPLPVILWQRNYWTTRPRKQAKSPLFSRALESSKLVWPPDRNYHAATPAAKRSIHKTHHGTNNKYTIIRFRKYQQWEHNE